MTGGQEKSIVKRCPIIFDRTMPLFIIAFLAAAVFATSVLSGVFGMAGGMILMAVLLGMMPVAAAMTLHAAIQLVSNGWRCILWRKHIVWGVLPWYGCGIAIGFALMLTIRYVPDKAVTLIMMGSLPLLAMIGGKIVHLSIANRIHTVAAAALLTFIQMTSGVVGPLLDLLYNNASFTRKQIISTKALTQTVMHLVRLTYFGALIPLLTKTGGWPEDLDIKILPVFLIASIAGTSSAALIVHRISDHGFKSASRVLIAAISLYCLGNGIVVLVGNR
ncbi:MAG TPA: sulfite exporter TauE/SafE family protein [Micavibrio sp.]|jgi:uncharacterized membrane protein YfcA